MYKIYKYSKDRARELGVEIKPSTNEKKKIDVYKDGKRIARIGAMGYFDYPTYIEKEGIDKANQKRRAYKARHSNNRNVKGSAGYYASEILW